MGPSVCVSLSPTTSISHTSMFISFLEKLLTQEKKQKNQKASLATRNKQRQMLQSLLQHLFTHV